MVCSACEKKLQKVTWGAREACWLQTTWARLQRGRCRAASLVHRQCMYPSRHRSSGSARRHLLAAPPPPLLLTVPLAASAACFQPCWQAAKSAGNTAVSSPCKLTPAAARLPKVIVQDKWKDGARNTVEGGGRKVCTHPPLHRSLCSSCTRSREHDVDAAAAASPPSSDQREQGAEQEEGVGAL